MNNITKYQIFAPNGTKTCIIEAPCIYINPTGGNAYILNKENPDIVKWEDILFPLTNGWTAIPLDVIIN